MSERLTRRVFLAKGIAGGLAAGLSANLTGCSGTSRKREQGTMDGIGGVEQSPHRGAEERDGMVLIPAGGFLMGTPPAEAERLAAKYGYHVSWLGGEIPQREIDLPAYWIDKYPVTNRQYYEFCQAADYPPRNHWGGSKPPEESLDHPVTFVNRADGEAYAKWAGKRLPTEAEWEKAARGTDGRLFPWGNTLDPNACCWNRVGADGVTTDPVTAHPRGASPFDVMDMAGNVAEWCADGPADSTAYCKGGCWLTTEVLDLRPAARGMSGYASNAKDFYGFRCAREVS